MALYMWMGKYKGPGDLPQIWLPRSERQLVLPHARSKLVYITDFNFFHPV